MAEYISRNEAINAVKSLESSMPAKDNYAKGYDAALGRVLIAVRAVPVKRGRWIHDRRTQWKCSNCGNFLDFDGLNCGRGSAFFCPNCGADMSEPNE